MHNFTQQGPPDIDVEVEKYLELEVIGNKVCHFLNSHAVNESNFYILILIKVLIQPKF
jgi:hypothetical protein